MATLKIGLNKKKTKQKKRKIKIKLRETGLLKSVVERQKKQKGILKQLEEYSK